jgi:hypothetical protein
MGQAAPLGAATSFDPPQPAGTHPQLGLPVYASRPDNACAGYEENDAFGNPYYTLNGPWVGWHNHPNDPDASPFRHYNVTNHNVYCSYWTYSNSSETQYAEAYLPVSAAYDGTYANVKVFVVCHSERDVTWAEHRRIERWANGTAGGLTSIHVLSAKDFCESKNWQSDFAIAMSNKAFNASIGGKLQLSDQATGGDPAGRPLHMDSVYWGA